MLSTFRSHAKGWIAWAFVILISVPFALWGVGQYRSLVTTDYVAKVNGAKIMPQRLERAYEQAFQQRQAQMNGEFNPDSKQQMQLKMQVLDQLIDRELLLQQATKDRLVVGPADVQAEIRQVPAFQANGHFDFQQYRLVLQNNNITPSQFESQVRSSLVMQQLQQGLGESDFSTPREVASLAALIQQQRKVSWFVLPVDAFKPTQPPGKDAVTAYYKAHQQAYSTPETVTISYLQLDLDTLEQRVKATSEDLEDFYRTHQSRYGIPPARKVAEIVIKPKAAASAGTPTAAAVAAAKAKIGKIREQVKASKDPLQTFAELARKDSDDAVSSRNGGSIGYVSRGQLPKSLDDAVFNLSGKGSLAGPIRTEQGWVLVQLLDERSGSVKPYDAVKAQVAQDYKAEKAKELYYKLDGKLANLTYENAGSLDEAAKALDLKIRTVSGVTRDEGTGIARNDAIRKAAFSDSVLKQHENSNPIKLGDQNAVVLRVSDVTPSKVKPLEEVRSDIVKRLDSQRAEQGAEQAAAAALTSLRDGQSMAVVSRVHHSALQGPKSVKRTDKGLPPMLAQALFTLPPAPGSQARYATAKLSDGSQAVYALLGVEPGKTDELSKAERSAYMQELARIHADVIARAYTDWLRGRADVKIVKDNIQ